MTYLEFFPYHNYRIRFKLTYGKELSGVIFEPMNHQERKKPDTVYEFVPERNIAEWGKAEQKGDKEKKKSLQDEIDITNIVWAERME